MTYDNYTDTHYNYLSSFVDLKSVVPQPSAGESVSSYVNGLSDTCGTQATETWADPAPSVQPTVTAAFTSS